MRGVFFIVGPTATGKSELAADVAHEIGAEIISADAFQVYRGFDLLSAKPSAVTLAKAPHHLIGEIDPTEEMNAAKFASRARELIHDISGRQKPVIVVGGTGLYVRAVTHGLSPLPPADSSLRAEFDSKTKEELVAQLTLLDPVTVTTIDLRNRRRLIRAIEICIASGAPVSSQRVNTEPLEQPIGVLIYREREELLARIDQRVVRMLDEGAVDEVRQAGPMSATSSQMIGFNEIRRLHAGEISRLECLEKIQRATRQYAKRQLTWFRRQTNFESLNLSQISVAEAIEWTTQKARLSIVHD